MSISINNLSKKYGKNSVLNGINYFFKDGEHYLIKGENGVGKSTFFKAILSQIHYDGYIEVKGRISYSPEEPIYPSYMTVHSFIKTFAQLTEEVDKIDEKIEEYLISFGMKGASKKQLGSLSKGQKEKVNIIEAILTPSEILILDEPLSGLDKDSKKFLMKSIKEDKRLIIIVSHETNFFRKKDFKILRLNENGIKDVL